MMSPPTYTHFMTISLRAVWFGVLAFALLTPAFSQEVPVRLSFKFILDASGNRPATGNINTVAEIDEQVTAGDQIFSSIISELRVEKLEVLDVAGHSEWYAAGNTDEERDGIRNAAIADPAGYYWRTNAVNVYITGASATAVSDFPPNNNIIIVCQGIFDTTVAHELGHILNLFHTHQPGGGDSCSDTIMDNENWSRDDIATNNFGAPYNNLTPAQQFQVDLVWRNLMSYHDPDNRNVLTFCQMDRESTQSYANRTTLLSRVPVYVDSAYTGTHNGSFTEPFQTIQQAINAGNLAGKAMVLESGIHTRPAVDLAIPSSVVTRKGASTVQDPPPPYMLPYSVQQSADPAVREPVRRALESDRRGDIAGVIAGLSEAESHASGRERTALQMEIAQRYRDLKQWADAEKWFRKAASGADQEELRKHALKQAGEMLERSKHEPAKGSITK